MRTPSHLIGHLSAARRVAWTLVGGVLGGLVGLVAVVASVSAAPAYTRPVLTGQLTDLGALVSLLAVLALGTLFVRRSWPWVPTVTGAILCLVLGLDSMLMLLGAAAVVLHRDRREGLVASVLAAAGSLVAGLRDGLRPWGETAWAVYLEGERSVAGTADPGLQLAVSLVIAALAAIVVLGVAWLLRSRRDLGETARAREEAEFRSETLETTASRLEERERLAQEVHDALSHRLSVIALHSGALGEAARDSDPGVSESAQVLRETAHRSLEDLRDLVGALREPAGAGRRSPTEESPRVPGVGLAALPDLVTSARASGAVVQATVLVRDADQASDLLNRAAFRITQEALTNAYKHSPGEPITLDVNAGPPEGVSIEVVNRMGVDSGLPGSGSGLVGMEERTAILGGEFLAGPDGRGSFVVRVRLPWQRRTDPAVSEP